jgi:hypothetical protein
LGLLARLSLAWIAGPADALRFPDAPEHRAIGRSVAAGDGFVLPESEDRPRAVARHAPGEAALVALGEALPGDALRTALAIQALAGGVALALAAWMAYRLAGPWAAVVTLVLLAFNPVQVFFASQLVPETCAGAAVTGAVAAGMAFVLPGRRDRSGSLLWAAAAGVALAAGAYFRPGLVGLVVPAGVLAAVSARRKRLLAGWLVGLAALALVLAPWVVRNTGRLGTPVLATGTAERLYTGATEATPGPDQPVRAVEETDEMARRAYFIRRTRELIAENPRRYVAAAARRALAAWHPGPRFRGIDTPLHSLPCWISFLAITVSGAAGVIALGRRLGLALWLLSPAAVVTLLAAATVGSVRCRVPAVPCLAALGGVGLAALLGRAHRPRPGSENVTKETQ